NYPNPFNPETTIRFTLSEPQAVSLKVYDTNGRLIKILADKKMRAGEHSLRFNATDLPSGTYLYNLTTDQGSQTRKMTLIK
ncbi:MAG TPA: T9SS C-terminal target domain-containing protein, partial [Balneolaceae bacterium]|nr:T9SS C-terminal target domain-containing protein [Balneolaceae bacterium]